MKKTVILIALAILEIASNSQEISQWRGINRDGVYNEQSLLKVWPEKGPEMLWYSDSIGDGYGSPVVANNMIFVNGGSDSVSYLFAFDLKGKLIWKVPNGKDFFGIGYAESFPGSRSAPTVVGNLVYSCSSNGRIACFETLTGKETWAVDMVKDLKGTMSSYGYSESLCIDGDNVYCYPGGTIVEATKTVSQGQFPDAPLCYGSKANIVALNRFTGKTVWESKALGEPVSFCSPMIIKLTSRNILVTFSIHHLMGIDAQTGELLWQHKQDTTTYGELVNTPLFSDGALYYIAGDGNGAVKLQLSANGKEIKEVWRNAEIKNIFSGFVKIGNQIFTTDDSHKLKTIDIATGQVTDTLKKDLKGSLIYADGMLYCYNYNGSICLIKLQDGKTQIVSKFKCDRGTREHLSHPVISKGVLYIRHGKSLMAYKII